MGQNPWAWSAVILPIFLALGYWLRWKKRSAICWSSFSVLGISADRWAWLSLGLGHLPIVLRVSALIFLVLALANPNPKILNQQFEEHSLDIVLVVDTSGSMRALDFTLEGKQVDRMAAVRSVLRSFVADRPGDRFGVVGFGSEVATLSPVTNDVELTSETIESLKVGMLGDATAIGDALAVGIRRLKRLSTKTKVMVLLTDGKQTAGALDTVTAAEAAKEFGIRIYAVGVGKPGKVPFPARSAFGGETITWVESDLDENALKEIAEKTSAKFFRAQDTDSLKNIYAEIDRIEKRGIIRNEKFFEPLIASNWLWMCLLLLCLEAVFSCTLWRRIPA